MARFRFRLNALKKIRETKATQCLREFSHAQNELVKELNEKKRLETEKQNTLQRREGLGSIPTSPHAYDLENKYLDRMNMEIERAVSRINRAQKLVDKKRQKLMDAKREQEVLEKLEQKQKALFEKEQQRKINSAYDDIYNSQSIRKQSGGSHD